MLHLELERAIGLNEIVSFTVPMNKRSLRVMKKLDYSVI